MEPLILARLVHFAATLTAGGTIWFALLVPRPIPAALDRRLRLLALVALALAVLSGLAWLALVAADVLGVPIAEVTPGGAWPVVTDIRFGQVAAVRLLLAVLLALLVPLARARPLQGVLALGFVALPALTGHAGALPGPAGYGAITADALHLLAAGAWLGGLPAFLLSLREAPGDPHADDRIVWTTRRFSQLAVVSVATLLGSGIINSCYLLSGTRDLLYTEYGQRLTLKLVLFAAMLAFAAVNRFRLTPALPSARARTALGRNTLAETGLGLAVLALVAVIGTLPPGGHAHSTTSTIPDDATFVHIHTAAAMADVTINPGRVGRVEIGTRLWRDDMSELAARAVTVALEPPNKNARSTIEHVAVREDDGTWRVSNVDCTQDGVWTVRLTITPREGSKIVLDAPIVIAR
ncbi:hypothetical protein DW352_06240 [Pseudolabrys taiwanensis]|uniref:Copper resistance protein D domain-containing protein n=1 Tax=Pseudolabrys taiwanensis TaxID=331696 RepID=A0A345ZTA5_9HYPH|nr:copper homeostasis membrane protein CopD [Pseudolabrys taiwanensis]AXK80152.1 hypothetical protein DW352_06240 [Pseudolabrys taiwanensis]